MAWGEIAGGGVVRWEVLERHFVEGRLDAFVRGCARVWRDADSLDIGPCGSFTSKADDPASSNGSGSGTGRRVHTARTVMAEQALPCWYLRHVGLANLNLAFDIYSCAIEARHAADPASVPLVSAPKKPRATKGSKDASVAGETVAAGAAGGDLATVGAGENKGVKSVGTGGGGRRRGTAVDACVEDVCPPLPVHMLAVSEADQELFQEAEEEREFAAACRWATTDPLRVGLAAFALDSMGPKETAATLETMQASDREAWAAVEKATERAVVAAHTRLGAQVRRPNGDVEPAPRTHAAAAAFWFARIIARMSALRASAVSVRGATSTSAARPPAQKPKEEKPKEDVDMDVKTKSGSNALIDGAGPAVNGGAEADAVGRPATGGSASSSSRKRKIERRKQAAKKTAGEEAGRKAGGARIGSLVDPSLRLRLPSLSLWDSAGAGEEVAAFEKRSPELKFSHMLRSDAIGTVGGGYLSADWEKAVAEQWRMWMLVAVAPPIAIPKRSVVLVDRLADAAAAAASLTAATSDGKIAGGGSISIMGEAGRRMETEWLSTIEDALHAACFRAQLHQRVGRRLFAEFLQFEVLVSWSYSAMMMYQWGIPSRGAFMDEIRAFCGILSAFIERGLGEPHLAFFYQFLILRNLRSSAFSGLATEHADDWSSALIDRFTAADASRQSCRDLADWITAYLNARSSRKNPKRSRPSPLIEGKDGGGCDVGGWFASCRAGLGGLRLASLGIDWTAPSARQWIARLEHAFAECRGGHPSGAGHGDRSSSLRIDLDLLPRVSKDDKVAVAVVNQASSTRLAATAAIRRLRRTLAEHICLTRPCCSPEQHWIAETLHCELRSPAAAALVLSDPSALRLSLAPSIDAKVGLSNAVGSPPEKATMAFRTTTATADRLPEATMASPAMPGGPLPEPPRGFPTMAAGAVSDATVGSPKTSAAGALDASSLLPSADAWAVGDDKIAAGGGLCMHLEYMEDLSVRTFRGKFAVRERREGDEGWSAALRTAYSDRDLRWGWFGDKVVDGEVLRNLCVPLYAGLPLRACPEGKTYYIGPFAMSLDEIGPPPPTPSASAVGASTAGVGAAASGVVAPGHIYGISPTDAANRAGDSGDANSTARQVARYMWRCDKLRQWGLLTLGPSSVLLDLNVPSKEQLAEARAPKFVRPPALVPCNSPTSARYVRPGKDEKDEKHPKPVPPAPSPSSASLSASTLPLTRPAVGLSGSDGLARESDRRGKLEQEGRFWWIRCAGRAYELSSANVVALAPVPDRHVVGSWGPRNWAPLIKLTIARALLGISETQYKQETSLFGQGLATQYVPNALFGLRRPGSYLPTRSDVRQQWNRTKPRAAPSMPGRAGSRSAKGPPKTDKARRRYWLDLLGDPSYLPPVAPSSEKSTGLEASAAPDNLAQVRLTTAKMRALLGCLLFGRSPWAATDLHVHVRDLLMTGAHSDRFSARYTDPTASGADAVIDLSDFWDRVTADPDMLYAFPLIAALHACCPALVTRQALARSARAFQLAPSK